MRRSLDLYGGFDHWSVSVHGEVVIRDPLGDPLRRRVARVLALANPGVLRATGVEPGSDR